MKKLCGFFKKDKVSPKPPNNNKKNKFINHHRKIVQRKSKLQLRTGKNLTIKPVDYKGKFVNIAI
tara:strand:- start:311 stop:505 length:195 start_codon:yes stop_codon:yes gene_type:complete